MATINDDTNTNADVRELTSKIQQFLSHQIESNGQLSEAAKESLTVASECIEQAYSIQKQPASKELLDIYRASKNTAQQQQQQSQQANSQQQQAPDPAQLISNLASTLFSQVGGNVVNAAATAAANLAANLPGGVPGAPGQPQTASSASAPSTDAPAPPTRTTPRKKASPAEVLAAESHKNQGNDCMKADRYQEAYDYYTQAIEIDNNNAIYYSNRAAASSKLGNHQAALRDCQEAIEIDPNYSKAYSRMGLSYASMDNHQRAREAYVKAVELDPLNETYKNNLAAAEEKLAEAHAAAAGQSANAGAAPGGPNVVNMIRSMMSNPEVMNLAMRSLQDPRLQSMFGLNGGGAAPGGGAPGAGGAH